MSPEEIEKQKCIFILEEYKRLYGETLKRLEFMDKIVNYQIIILTAVIGIIGSFLSGGKGYQTILYILLCSPVLFFTLSIYSSLNVLWLVEISGYIEENLKPKLKQFLENTGEIFGWESFWKHKTLGEKNGVLKGLALGWSLIAPVMLIVAYIYSIFRLQLTVSFTQYLILSIDAILLLVSFQLCRRQYLAIK